MAGIAFSPDPANRSLASWRICSTSPKQAANAVMISDQPRSSSSIGVQVRCRSVRESKVSARIALSILAIRPWEEMRENWVMSRAQAFPTVCQRSSTRRSDFAFLLDDVALSKRVQPSQ